MNHKLETNKKILVIGATVIDMIVRVERLPKSGEDIYGEHIDTLVGGCAYNVQQIINQFLSDIDLFTPVGKGAYANIIRFHFAKKDIRIFIQDQSQDNGWNISYVEPDGERTFLSIPGIETSWKDEWFEKIKLQDYDFIYISGYELEGVSGEVIIRQLREKKADHAKIIFDPGPRVSAIDQNVLETILQERTIVHCNLSELMTIVPGDSYKESAEKLHQLTNEAVVVTLGSKGCYFVDKEESGLISAHPVKVVDTIGAGDSHTGAFISGIAQGMTIKEACQLGNDISAKVVQQSGGSLSINS